LYLFQCGRLKELGSDTVVYRRKTYMYLYHITTKKKCGVIYFAVFFIRIDRWPR
jgi:hypothetical protein